MASFIRRLFSISFQIELSFTTLVLIIAFALLSSAFLVRYKYLAKYIEDPKNQSISSEVKKGDIVDSISKKKRKNEGNTNYLDEFLSAIKIFGYLERPVFHELTKNMTTQKLNWDEILYLDQKLGFSILVDGNIQILIKINNSGNDNLPGLKDLDDNKDDVVFIGDQKYQLLNEIKSGTPLSSLNSTLELFNPYEDDSEVSLFNRAGSSASSLNLDPKLGSDLPFDNEYPEIIAKPKYLKHKRGATIAIIPALAFQRIQVKYPKATAHIVTMVRNRLFKVTMNTINNYLGLTDEVIESEVQLNAKIDSTLPSHLTNVLMEKYSPNNSITKNVSLESLTRKKANRRVQKPKLEKSASRLVSLNSVEKSSHPGDLFSSVPISRKSVLNMEDFQKDAFTSSTNVNSTETTFSDEREETEETSTRIAIIENIFKLLGVQEDSPLLRSVEGHMPNSRGDSISSSPSMTGLTKLASENMFNPLNKNKIYDDYTSRNRFGSFSSIGSRSNSISRVNSPKIFNTINQSQLSNYNHIDDSHIDIKNKLQSSFNSFDFNTVKDDFAKNLSILYFEPNKTVIEQDSFNSGLYYVVDGSLTVEYSKSSGVTRRKNYIPKGGIAGYLSSVLGIRSLTTVKSGEKGVVLAHITKDNWNKLTDRFYQLQLPLAIKYKKLLSKQILAIDFALEWCHIPAGEALAAEGDQANGFHIILSGRFRVIQSKDIKGSNEDFDILGEYGHGESIGEVEVLTASRRTTSLIAIRDSETARIPRTLFEILSSQNPSIMVKVSRIVASKVASTQNDIIKMQNLTSPITAPTSKNSSSYFSGNYKTITVLPTVTGLPVREFATKLINSLEIIGRSVISLDQTSILDHLGRHAFDDSLAQLKLSGFFATLEEQYETVVYICDSTLKSSWTATCIGQGDCILLLANAEDYEVAENVGDFEKLLIKVNTTARTDLCLLHPDRYVPSGSTSIWLKDRTWVQGHHHIQMACKNTNTVRFAKKKSIISDIAAKIGERANGSLRQRLQIVRSRLGKFNLNGHDEQSTAVSEPYKNDFLRLARLLSNEAVGLVLGGGGARGISHLGVVTALERHGIPVDIIGGTSIGSFVGGLYGLEYNSVSIYGKVKKFSKRMSSYWISILDLTLPVTSYLTGYEFNRGLWKVLGFSELEDSWVKFYCNSTNITNSTMDIHESGYAWRFIRASMSLAGLFPPIAYNGCMLLDGGYLDNLPVLEMKRRGIKYILAVDVGSVDDRSPMNYGDTLSGLWVVFNRWNPFSKHPDVPNMMDIQLRLAYVASVNALEIAKRTPGVMYMRPPIENYGTLDFGKFEEIYDVGLEYAENVLNSWEKEGKLPKIVGRVDRKSINTKERPLFRRNSF